MNKQSLNIRTLFAVLVVACALTLQWNAADAKDGTKSGLITDLLGQLDRVKGQIVSLRMRYSGQIHMASNGRCSLGQRGVSSHR